MKKNIRKLKGFTLIEMLVSLFIFAMIFTMIGGFVKFISGKVGSSRTNTPATELRAITDLINQRMASANANLLIANGSTSRIEGFTVINNVLAIAIYNGGIINCHFIGKDPATNKLRLRVVDTAGSGVNLRCRNNNLAEVTTVNASNYDRELTSDKVTVGSFVVTREGSTLPYATLNIRLSDATDVNNSLQYRNVYALDYFTYKKFQIP